MDQLIQLLRKFNLSEPLITHLQSRIKMLSVAKKTRLLSPGQLQENFYFIYEGIVRSLVISGEREWTKAFYSSGSFLISYQAVLLNTPAEECFETCSQTRLFFVNRNDFTELFLLYPEELSRLSQQIIGKALKSAGEHAHALSVKSARERYLDFSQKFPDINKTVNRKHLASYLGITLEALSRLERKLRDEAWDSKT